MNKFKLSFFLTIALILTLTAPAFAAEKVTICHKPGTSAEKTLEVSSAAVSAHLGHGDYTGECGPQSSAGCAAVNATVPDPQIISDVYIFGIRDLTFNPGDMLHADITILIPTFEFGGQYTFAVIRNGGSGDLAVDIDYAFAGSNVLLTSSVDYTVVAGDDADSIYVSSANGGDFFTLQSVHLTCTPA